MEHNQHGFLKELGLSEKDNQICFDGEKWCANGESYSSVSPSTNGGIGECVYASVDDYERCITNMDKV
jgi:hypothetical protein